MKNNMQLPKNWTIKVTPENRKMLSEWLQSKKDFDPHYFISGWIVDNPREDNSYMYWTINPPENYEEITSEQFKQYIMNKELLGYKLKPEYEKYRKAALKMNGPSDYLRGKTEYLSIEAKAIIYNLKEAKVLDEWFEPVYKENNHKYEVGDWVTVLSNNRDDKHSCTDTIFYKIGKVGRVTRIEKSNSYDCGQWVKLNNCIDAITNNQVRLATEHEIFTELKRNFIKNTGIDIGSEVKLIHNNELTKVSGFTLLKTGSIENSLLNIEWFEKNSSEKYQLGIKLFHGICGPDDIELYKPLTFGGHEVTFEKHKSGVRVTCNGETGTLSQLKNIFNYFSSLTFPKFGDEVVTSITNKIGIFCLDDLTLPIKNITIGCTTGTWKELCNIIDEAEKYE